MLTFIDQGMLVCDALNMLWRGPCCADCCAPCELLRRLADANYLTTVVKQAPEHLWGPTIAWWSGDGVDLDWLRSQWACQNHPPCKESCS